MNTNKQTTIFIVFEKYRLFMMLNKHCVRQIILWRLFIHLIWLTLFMTCSVTYTCHQIPIWNNFRNVKEKRWRENKHCCDKFWSKGANIKEKCRPKMCACVCVCVCERERERIRKSYNRLYLVSSLTNPFCQSLASKLDCLSISFYLPLKSEPLIQSI